MVTNQADLDALAGVTRIEGSLEVTADDVVLDFSPLDSLKTITGNVRFSRTYLDVIEGFPALERIGVEGSSSGGSLGITSNLGLDEIRGFEALKYVGKIEVARNDPLERVSGFDALKEGGIDIYTNSSLETLPDFESLITDGSYNDGIRISNNRILSALPSFSSLKEAYRLEISRSGLSSIAGFESLEILKAPTDAWDSALDISGHYAVTEITGFDNLVTNGAIMIEDNRSLTSISGFGSEEDGSGITISDNEAFECAVEPQASLPFLPVGSSTGNLIDYPTN